MGRRHPARSRGVIAPRPQRPALGSARSGLAIRPPLLTVASPPALTALRRRPEFSEHYPLKHVGQKRRKRTAPQPGPFNVAEVFILSSIDHQVTAAVQTSGVIKGS